MKVPKLRFKDDSGQSFPEWSSLKLAKLASVYDGTHMTPDYKQSGIPFYSVEHLTSNNFSKTKFIAEDVYDQENKRVKLEKGDILMTRIGDIGTPRYIDWDVKASFYVSLALIKQSTTVNSQYLAHYISSSFFQRELHQRTIHVAFPKKINLGEIGECLVSLPEKNEQTKIANFLTAVDEKITQLTQKYELLVQYKKGVMQQIFSQELRFKDDYGQDFPEWVDASFDDLFYVANNKKTQLKSTEYLEVGSTPIVDQGQKLIVGFTNTAEVYEDIPVIIFGDHTRIIKWIDFQFATGADGTQVLKSKNLLDLKFGYYALSNIELPNLGYSRHMKELKEQFFIIPSSKTEQTKIANFLSAIDDKLTLTQNQLAAAKQYKQGLLQQMFV